MMTNLTQTPTPMPVSIEANMDEAVVLDGKSTVTVECPDPAAAKWVEAHFAEWFPGYAPKVAMKIGSVATVLPDGDEAYALKVDASCVKVTARTLVGVRWAAYTIRQLAIAKRGTFKAEGLMLPKSDISDCPLLPFRAVHLCWFPETRPAQIERCVRLAALLKFNYVIIEPWGTFASERNPWWGWPKKPFTMAEAARLAAVGHDLGVTLVPQINVFGHASGARGCTLKHSVLDFHPEYAPLFEPNGWRWCLSNPETQRVLRELIAEMHESFGSPSYFHIGCDEAHTPSCPLCGKADYAELVLKHIGGIAGFLRKRGARAMMWHDMLVTKGDPEWKGLDPVYGSKATASILGKLPKDIIICDYEYSYSNMREVRKDWPTASYFRDRGFDVALCPWKNCNTMKPMAEYLAKIGGFGLVDTTWHHLRGEEWKRMFVFASAAAWGTTPGTSFQETLRFAGCDMARIDYEDTGYYEHQVPPTWWIDN